MTKNEIIEALKAARAKSGTVVNGVLQHGIPVADIDAILGTSEEEEKEMQNGATDEKIKADQEAADVAAAEEAKANGTANETAAANKAAAEEAAATEAAAKEKAAADQKAADAAAKAAGGK